MFARNTGNETTRREPSVFVAVRNIKCPDSDEK